MRKAVNDTNFLIIDQSSIQHVYNNSVYYSRRRFKNLPCLTNNHDFTVKQKLSYIDAPEEI